MQSAGTRTVGDLARRLAVDERTVRRDIDRLRDLDVPIETIRGRYGGYRLAPSYRVPPLMFSEDEAVATLTALTGSRASGLAGVPDTAIATATAKIRRSLPARLAQRVDVLVETVVLGSAPNSEAVDSELLLTAADAIRHRRPLALTYRSGDAISQRTLHPHDLVAYGGRWYLVGLDSRAGERRTFRLDRVRALRALGGTFPAPADHDALAALVAGFAHADYRYLVRLRIHAEPTEIAQHLPASVAVLEEGRRGTEDTRPGVRPTIRAERLDWLPGVLLAVDRPVIVEQPDELRTLVASAAKRLRSIAVALP